MGKTFLLLSVGLCVSVCQSVSASTWYVDGSVVESGDGGSWETAFREIEEGIDAAGYGDTVIVAEGIYVENIHFYGKNIVLRSTEPLDSQVVRKTIIDGDDNGCVVTFDGTEEETCVLSGFTIRNGKAEYGGGVYGGPGDTHSKAAVENNIITANSADFGGGLVHCDGVVQNNIILINSASSKGKYLGGGGLLRCHGTIRNNVIVRNGAWWYGGGLFECHGTIENNVISGNLASDGAGLYKCHGVVQNNTISGNSASHSGGGIYQCHGAVQNNIIAHNSADFGGGLYWCKGVIRNNTICGNAAEYSGGIHGVGGPIRNCIIWGNSARHSPQLGPLQAPTYSCIQDWTGGGEGNISENPHFSAAYRLLPDSPCIDAGRNDDWMSEAFDAEGNPRVINGTVDMGAYEYAPQGPQVETWYVNGSLPQPGDGTSWQTAFKTIQRGIDAASHGDTVIVAEGTYRENVNSNGKNLTLRSTDPTDPGVVANTVIDGSQNGTTVDFLGTEDETCVLAGFTIRNGGGEGGCGISGGTSGHRTHATIRNNTISKNSSTGLVYCDGLIQNNTVCGNSGSGIVWCYGIIQNNVAAGNSGSGLHGCRGTIQNNTVCGNAAEYGEGLRFCRGTIVNCIVWGNVGREPLWDCSSPAYCCIERWTAGGEGNINLFPYFADPDNGDYHLKSYSPCIDAGDPGSPFSNEPEPNGGRINMGAYGNTAEASPKSPDSDNDGLPDDWETRFFGDVDQRTEDDPDGDLMPNGEEYSRGFSPISPPAMWYVDASLSASGDGRTWETAFKTIQHGIDAASECDTVIVGPGSYAENIHFDGKNIILTSTNALDPDVVADTVIDGNGAGPVVTFLGTEDDACVLTGFTVGYGSAEYGGGICGGTPIYPTHATIEHNVITENKAEEYGGGVAFCDGAIRHSTISDNSAEDGGGGLYHCGGTIRYNTIERNSADGGGGLYACDGAIEHNLIARNSADHGGGGLSWCDGTLLGNTIARNSADYGGGLSYCTGRIRNCIIWGNEPRNSRQMYESSEPAYSCIEAWTGGGEGNILFDPYFVNPWSDFHLKPSSPCIDAGDPASPYWNEPEPNGGRVNIGAYGNTPEAASRSADEDADGLPDDWELRWFDNLEQEASGDADGDRIANVMEYHYAWNPKWASDTVVESLTKNQCYENIQTAVCEAAQGDQIVVHRGFYVENVRFGGKNVALRSTNPLDTGVVATTIIDGNQTGPVISFRGDEDDRCVVSGFTIQNGFADAGGGINGGRWDRRTHATIQDNVIRHNSASEGGGLAYCDGTIRNNSIWGNSAEYGGGGLYRCDGNIGNNVIFANFAEKGGGLYICQGTVRNNAVVGNSAWHGGGGLYACDGEIDSNLISANFASGGGGLCDCDGDIRNNTIVGNWASGTYNGQGGGLAGCEGAIVNCIIWGNSALDGAELYESSQPVYCCIQGWTGGGEGNISEPPLFLNPDGPDRDPKTFLDNNYRLAVGSPCIDAGVNQDWMWAANDPDGNPRIFYGGLSLTVDIGAYEYGSWPFRFAEVVRSVESVTTLTWKSRPGDTYVVWSASDLSAANPWTAEATVASGGETTSWTDADTASTRKFYRIEVK